LEVFHDREVRESADRFEGVSFEEDCLVTVGQLAVARSPVGAPFDEAAAELGRLDAELESASDRVGLGEGGFDLGFPVGGKVGVGVEKQEDVALGDRGGLVHLGGASGGGAEDDRARSAGNFSGAIGAATVGDDDFDLGMTGDVGERRGEIVGFVEGGNDDGNSRHNWI
jgi:hypothetical protein